MYNLEKWRGRFSRQNDINCNPANHKIAWTFKYMQYHYWPTVGKLAQYDLNIFQRGLEVDCTLFSLWHCIQVFFRLFSYCVCDVAFRCSSKLVFWVSWRRWEMRSSPLWSAWLRLWHEATSWGRSLSKWQKGGNLKTSIQYEVICSKPLVTVAGGKQLPLNWEETSSRIRHYGVRWG